MNGNGSDPSDVAVHPAADAAFVRFYEARLRPLLRRHDDALRAANAAAMTAALVAFVAVGILALIFLPTLMGVNDLMVLLIVAGVAGSIGAALTGAVVRSLKAGDWTAASYKQLVVDPVVKFVSGGALAYRPGCGFKASFIEGLDLIGEFDRFESEDLVTGTLGSTELQAAEVKAIRVETVRVNKQDVEIEHEVFRGLVLAFDFNKDFTSQTFIVSKNGGLLGFLASLEDGFSSWGKGDRITLEDPEFNRDFKIYSSDPVEARYIFTPDFMARFHALYVRYPGGVSAVFRAGCLILMLATPRDRYEAPGSMWDNLAAARTVATDIGELYAFVNLLNLNTRIWTKR